MLTQSINLDSSPLVSVIIPAYNAEAFIHQTIESVLSQSYRNIEVLVIDDGSQDRTAQIVQTFIRKDNRVQLLQQSNAGVAAARNLGIYKSQGEYIAPIDADDIWYPQTIEKQVQCILKADSSVGLVYAWSVCIDENGLLNGSYKYSEVEGKVYLELLQGNFIGNASAVLIRRICWEKVGDYNTQLKAQNAQGCEDWDLYLRIAENYEFRVVPEMLVGYRQTNSSMSCNCQQMAKSYQLMMADVYKRNPQLPSMILKVSSASFYLYLSSQSAKVGNYGKSLFWRYQALKTDNFILLNRSFYKPTVKTLVKYLAQPITSLIWSNKSEWLEFKSIIKKRLHLTSQTKSVADINQLVSNTQNKLTYFQKLQKRRWNRIINEICLGL